MLVAEKPGLNELCLGITWVFTFSYNLFRNKDTVCYLLSTLLEREYTDYELWAWSEACITALWDSKTADSGHRPRSLSMVATHGSQYF